MNRDPRRKAKNNFQKYFFKLMINVLFRKTRENVRKHRDVKLATTEKGRDQLVSKPKYQTANFFAEYLLAIEMKKTQIFMNKTVYSGLSILELSKILMYEFGMIM